MFFAIFLSLIAHAVASRARIAPVEMVLRMLNEMKTKGTGMLEDEKKAFGTYSQWVDDRTTELGFEATTAERKIEDLVSFASKADSDVSKLKRAIGDLDADIARLEADKKAATDIRTQDHNEFLKTEADFSESVDALGRAIEVVSKQAYDRPQAQALLQQMSSTVPGMRKVFASFLQEQAASTGNVDGAPEVAGYKSQTSGVLSILESLLDKFKAQLDDLVTDESNKAHYYDLELIHLTDTIEKSNADRSERIAARASLAEASAEAKGELAETRASLAENKKFVSDMKATFQSKSATFQQNQKVRAEELEAIAEAIKIISSPDVADSYSNRVKLVQTADASAHVRPFALLQTLRNNNRVSTRERVAELLQRHAAIVSSRDLSVLSANILAATPFAKVIEMIEDMLARLKEQAEAEASHKQWCDEQLKTNKLKREKETASVERLIAQSDAQGVQIEKMTQELATLATEQERLTKSMAEATTLRKAEKTENAAIVADAQAGVTAVKNALVVLREFYAKQAALLQMGSFEKRQVPELEAYGGMGGEKTGVVGMLEVIESDFARLEADTKASEAQAATEYDSFMADAREDKQNKHDEEVKTSLAKDQKQFEQTQTRKELALVEEELAAANKYYASLKPSCLEVHVSYEERAARRKEEIAALKEAYSILSEKSVS
jgi:hypothetical protein